MTLTLCPISSLHKLRQEDPVPQPLTRERVLAGERFSFQVAVSCTDPALLRFARGDGGMEVGGILLLQGFCGKNPAKGYDLTKETCITCS